MLADYQLFKETHEAVLQIPFVKMLLEQRSMCKCKENKCIDSYNEGAANEEKIKLEIIDVSPVDAPNLDSIADYINAIDPSEEEQEEQVQEEEEQEE